MGYAGIILLPSLTAKKSGIYLYTGIGLFTSFLDYKSSKTIPIRWDYKSYTHPSKKIPIPVENRLVGYTHPQ